MFVFPPNLYVEILMPNVIVLGRGAYGKWLGHENGALMNNIYALVKEAPESQLGPSAMWEHNEKASGTNQEESPHQNMTMLAPWSWTSQPAEL